MLSLFVARQQQSAGSQCSQHTVAFIFYIVQENAGKIDGSAAASRTVRLNQLKISSLDPL